MNQINSNSYSQIKPLKIIDPHVHFSPNDIDFYGDSLKPDILLKSLDVLSASNQNLLVEKALVTNLECIDTPEHIPGKNPLVDEIKGNIKTLELCKKNPRLLPVAVCQPGHGDAKNIDQILKHNKFYALKFHPYYLGINANHKLYEPYINLAEKYKIPCVFHSANGASDPKLIYDIAKKHPNVPFVLFHSNMETDHKDAINIVKDSIKNKDANLYLELSWVDQNVETNTIISMIKEVGADKILFGTDSCLGGYGKFDNNGRFIGDNFYVQRVNKIQKKIRENFESKEAEEIVNKIFYLNNKKIFKLNSNQSNYLYNKGLDTTSKFELFKSGLKIIKFL